VTHPEASARQRGRTALRVLLTGLWALVASPAAAQEAAAPAASGETTPPATTTPAPVRAPELVLRPEDLARAPDGAWHTPGLRLPAIPDAAPIVDPAADAPGLRLLRSLAARGRIAGFEGLLYDNRDRGHSRLSRALFPRMTHLRYDEALRAQNADYGLAGLIRHPAIVLGNSSTAFTRGDAPRSQSRFAMTSAVAAQASARLYFANHLYVYPEHRDYDAVDLFPANWPYHVISQGSSYSDRPFLEALAATMAAFPPDTRAAMAARGLVAPTLQMILRRNLAFVRTEAHYLSGPAHRPVLGAGALRPARMVAHANGLGPGDIPPLAELSVTRETFADAAGLAGMSERLFTTPAAIARVWRGFSGTQEMEVAAAAAVPEGSPPARFTWVLLQGDPARVQIAPLDARGTRARITVHWHDAITLPGRPGAEGRRSARVDIGVFAHTPQADGSRGAPGAPSILSVSFPLHQLRDYGPQTGAGTRPSRLRSVDYDAQGRGARFDPVLHWSAPWRDAPVYDAAGAITGWQRSYSDLARPDSRAAADQTYWRSRGDGGVVLSDVPPPKQVPEKAPEEAAEEAPQAPPGDPAPTAQP
jgi:hypothetical protein